MTITIIDSRQTLADVAIKYLGDIESLYALAMLNGLSVTDSLAVGQQIILPPVANQRIATYFKDNDITPITTE